MARDYPHPYIPKLKEQFAAGRISRREFLRTSTLLGLSASAAYAFAGKVTGTPMIRSARAAVPKGGTIRIGMGVQEVKNPHAFNWVQPGIIATQVLGRLTVINQDNIAEPWLCERWEASDDLRTWTFKLRDLKWHNGRQFTADDVIWNLNHILDPATGSSSVGLMKGYLLEEYDTGKKDKDGKPVMSTRLWDANAIEKLDDRTIRLNLKVPQLAIPEHLDHYTNVIMDPEEGGEFGPGSNGLGAFTLAEHAVGIKAVLEARKEPFFRGGPYIDRLEFVDIGEDPSANIAALASKQVHGLYQVDTAQYEILKRIPHVNVHEVATAATAVVQMIITRKPFDHPKVRLAMRYGMDCGEVLKLAQRGLGLRGEHHFVCPIHPEYAPLPEMKRDPVKARQLLKEAGYPDGVEFEINAKKDPAWELAAVQAMVEQWKDAGIRAKINVMPTAQFWDVWDKFDCGFVEWAHRPLGFMVLSLGFRTGVPWNPTGFADKEFDDLLTKAEGTLDVEKRRAIMKEIETIMQQRGPIAQPVWRSIITGMDKRVKGYRMHPQYHFRGEELAIET
ncbi:MAG: ABC transporter substrate-binding protein [Alphaproteobacteria bacterium]|nr:MAG: ABC transporter substrate-binding protein [Alphaproteobacteria bacterium]